MSYYLYYFTAAATCKFRFFLLFTMVCFVERLKIPAFCPYSLTSYGPESELQGAYAVSVDQYFNHGVGLNCKQKQDALTDKETELCCNVITI
jgi:hypothetical protein